MSEEQVYEFVKMIAGLSTVEYGAVPQQGWIGRASKRTSPNPCYLLAQHMKALKRTANRLLPDMERPPVDSVGVDAGKVEEAYAVLNSAIKSGLPGGMPPDADEVRRACGILRTALSDSTGEGLTGATHIPSASGEFNGGPLLNPSYDTPTTERPTPQEGGNE